MKLIKVCIAINIATLLFACNNGSGGNTKVKDMQLDEATSPGLVEKSEEHQSDYTFADTSVSKFTPPPKIVVNGNGPAVDWDKKIIKTADVRLELKDFKTYDNAIHQNLKIFGAYIASEEQTQNDGAIENTMVIKVPVDKFEHLLNTFSGEGVKVIQRRINTNDVTGEVIDTKGRIESKKQTREKYFELLGKAKNMKEILEVQREISSLQEELEAGLGWVNYLSHQSSFSTINLTYYQYSNNYLKTPTFINQLAEAFKTGGAIVISFLLLLVTVWPLILLGVAALLMIKYRKYSISKVAKKI